MIAVIASAIFEEEMNEPAEITSRPIPKLDHKTKKFFPDRTLYLLSSGFVPKSELSSKNFTTISPKKLFHKYLTSLNEAITIICILWIGFHKFKFVFIHLQVMSFGVDTLGGLVEKLKQLVNDTQNNYESFFDSTQLFKQGKMDSNEYFSRMGEFLISSSALNFLSCRVILELKSDMDKNFSTKGKNEKSTSSTLPSGNNGGNIGTGGGSAGSLGINGFISTGGSTGPASLSSPPSVTPRSIDGEYELPLPQEAPTFKPVDIVITKQDQSNIKASKKNCIVCNALIPKQAKFCSKCGNSQ